MLKKTYILDTSVIIENPNCFSSFEKIFLPIDVIEELDKLKTQSGLVGQNARLAIRNLENGIKNVEFDKRSHSTKFENCADNRILASALNFKKSQKRNKTIFVSKDFNLRLKAKILGIETEDYFETGKFENLYKGFSEIEDEKLGEELLQYSFIQCPKELKNNFQNECFLVKGSEKGIALARKIGDKLRLIQTKKIYGIESKNKEQAFAMDLLTDSKVHLVTFAGSAGTGKSLISLAAGLQQVLDQGKYSKLIIYKPFQPVGKDIGFLPGSQSEKLKPWMASILDNLENLLSGRKFSSSFENKIENYERDGKIAFEAMTYIRGRSINNSFILVDEASNLNKEEIKAILTRAGHNTKIVLTGDIEQIDRSDLDAENNGLTYVIEKFKSSELSGHVTLQRCERSALAALAAQIL